MAKEFIIAIELGSSRITGVAGKKNQDGSMSILAVAQEDSSACIRKGVVYNLDRTVLCLSNIIKKLETTLKAKIAHVYVGVGGQSIRSVKNVVPRDLPPETVVTQDIIDELMDSNRGMTYPDQIILDAIMQEYKVDNQYQLDPAGIQCGHLEGNFLNILWRRTFYNALNNCFNKAGIAIVEMYLAPLALAESVLTETERRSGCMLVDMGADTTTVSVYYKNILRHIAVIPIGGNNITKDIASLQMEESAAEEMKVKYGSAYTDNKDIDSKLELPIDDDRKITSRKFIEIVEARTEEIVENAWYQMPTEYADKMLGGIVLTGGGSNMPNIIEAFRKYTPIDKIRIAKFITRTVNSKLPEITAHDGRMNTVLGLLEKGDKNCAGEDINNDLFGTAPAKPGLTTAAIHKVARPVNETTGRGIVQTEPERQLAEEEAAKKKEAARKKEEEEAEAERKRQEEEKRKEGGVFHKLANGARSFFNQIIKEEE